MHILRNSILLGVAVAIAVSFMILAPDTAFHFCVFSACETEQDTNYGHIIDVRQPDEFGRGHVQGAINIPYDQLVEHIANIFPDKQTTLSVYCRNGNRSTIATRALEQLGYAHVRNLGTIQNAGETLKLPIVH